MALKKDKQKVLGEVFDDERIRSFLQYQAPENTNPSYHLLEKAYRGMQAENFATFVDFFLQAGHDINAKNAADRTFLQEINDHRLAEPYIEVLKANGAH